jgi:hypothetical protein
MPLLDLKDLKVINYHWRRKRWNNFRIRKNIHLNYRNYSSKIIELEQQGADFFLRNVFEIDDLMRIDETEKDMSIFYLTDIQDKPKLSLYVEFTCWNLPTNAWKGDADQPGTYYLLMKHI